jgi:hypothetical protein
MSSKGETARFYRDPIVTKMMVSLESGVPKVQFLNQIALDRAIRLRALLTV